MEFERWIELEFNALRAKILALGEAERSSVKFYVPAAAVVYGVPYFLFQHMPKAVSDEQHQTFLWIFCPTVAGLLILAMIQSLFWSVDGVRRIGMYIKVAIEPRTNHGLRWESVLYELSQKQRQLPSDSSTIGIISVVANVVAATAAGFTFLHGCNRFWPAAAAVLLASPSLWILSRIYRSAESRRAYSDQFTHILESTLSPVSEPPSKTAQTG
jgi:hypothetical protein